jgi:hypothetical protein
MKNILLTTTALATLFAGVASASTAHKGHAAHKHVAHKEKSMMDNEGLSVSVGGILEGQAAARSQKSEYTSANTSTSAPGNVYKRGITPGNESIGFNTNAQAYIKAANKTASGTKYGAQVAVATTTATQIQQGQTSFNRTFLYTESDIGRFEAGSNDSVASTMRTGADSIARATGGIDGDWANYVALNTYVPTTYLPANTAVVSSNFITAPVTALTLAGYNGGAVELPRNITYYTPEYNGFQAGLSYTPDNSNYGNNIVNVNSTASGYSPAVANTTAKNIFSGGLSWKGEFSHKQALKVSAVGETSSTTVTPAQQTAGTSFYDNQSAIFGAEYTYDDFSVAASYGNQGKSGLQKNTTGVEVKGGSFWTVGAAYVQDQIGGSVTYMSSELNTNAFNLVSLGLDYQVAPGLLPYFEVSYFTMKQKLSIASNNNAASAYKNNGTAFILGTKLSF